MASTSGGDPGGSGTLPPYMDPLNEFGAMTTLLLTGKDEAKLPSNPFFVGKCIEEWAGPIEDAKSEGKGSRYILKTRKPSQVAKLLDLKELTDGTKVSVQLHPKLNVSRCVVSSFDLLELSEEELETELASQGVVKARRIVKRNKENTPAIILTFNRSTHPRDLKVGVLRVKTRPFYPSPMLCFQCFEYGHIRQKCPNSKRCFNCSQQHEDQETCEEMAFCVNCKDNHRPSSRQCPVYQNEVTVIRTKVDFNLTYPEARNRVQRGLGSYAQAAAQPRLDNARLVALETEMKRKQEKIEKLEQELSNRQKLDEKLNMIIRQNQEKDAKINQLLEIIKQKDERIQKLEAYTQNLKKYIDVAKLKPRTDSQSSEPAPETENKKKQKRPQPQPNSERPGPSISSPPRKQTNKNRSPIMTRQSTKQLMEDVETISDSEMFDSSFKIPETPNYGSQHRKQ